jgi:hypothetical protein
LSLLLLWLVAVVDGATTWMTWLTGAAGVLTFWLVPVARPERSPVAAAVGPALIGMGLLALFVAGLVTHASGWLTWFIFAFAAGYLLFAGFAFQVRAFAPQMESRRPSSEL